MTFTLTGARPRGLLLVDTSSRERSSGPQRLSPLPSSFFVQQEPLQHDSGQHPQGQYVDSIRQSPNSVQLFILKQLVKNIGSNSHGPIHHVRYLLAKGNRFV